MPTSEQMRHALLHFAKAAMNLTNSIEVDMSGPFCPLLLERHPFNLELPTGFVNSALPGYPIWCYRNVPDFHGRIAQMAIQQTNLRLLRIIKVKAFPEEDDRHRVYHEAVFGGNVLIHTEATDFSGAGGGMRHNLEGLFEILSTVYGVDIETVTISYQDGQTAEEYMTEADRQQYLERHQGQPM